MDFYNELKSWQGAIGSLTGFGALIIGALFNYHLNRKRDERLRREEIISVASALYAEIVSLRRSVARMANAVAARYLDHGLHGGNSIDKYFIEQFDLPKPELFSSLASKVGILDSRLALEIVSFYSLVEEAKAWLPRLQENTERPYSYSVNYVLDPAIDAVTKVLPALRTIEKMAGIGSNTDDLDLKRATSAQEVENINNEY